MAFSFWFDFVVPDKECQDRANSVSTACQWRWNPYKIRERKISCLQIRPFPKTAIIHI